MIESPQGVSSIRVIERNALRRKNCFQKKHENVKFRTLSITRYSRNTIISDKFIYRRNSENIKLTVIAVTVLLFLKKRHQVDNCTLSGCFLLMLFFYFCLVPSCFEEGDNCSLSACNVSCSCLFTFLFLF